MIWVRSRFGFLELATLDQHRPQVFRIAEYQLGAGREYVPNALHHFAVELIARPLRLA